MASTQLFVGSTTRIYCAEMVTTDVYGNETEFTSTAGTVTAQVLALDGTTALTSATSMSYNAGAAVVNGTPYASGNWSLAIDGTSAALVAGTEYLVQYIGKLTGSTDPDMTLRVQVAAQYLGGT